ncbi:hypothetical protein [Sporolactobacillus terrae]|uniref:hypothetical protein n=1 Tax=Sporolactobacillus terrae TaxID=269673 RepID=UPI0004917A00|nr:hypothetical protein [Sporolactobacillus terrae]
MTLSFIGCKNSKNNSLVTCIVDEIHKNIDTFIYIGRIFDLYKNNLHHRFPQIEQTIRLTIHSPRFKATLATKEYLIRIMIEIYHQKRFSDLRGEILEQTISLLGPFFVLWEDQTCYLEPTIYDGNYLVGESENLCDSVFHKCDNKTMEFIECKANIASVIPGNLPFGKIKKEHQNKIKYLDHVHRYLTKYYKEPKIVFACYNNNYEGRLNNARDNWGYSYMNFLGPMDIVKQAQAK